MAFFFTAFRYGTEEASVSSVRYLRSLDERYLAKALIADNLLLHVAALHFLLSAQSRLVDSLLDDMEKQN